MTAFLLAYTLGISVIFHLPKECQPGIEDDGRYYEYRGCWIESTPKTIYVEPKLKGQQRTFTLLHELGHTQCIKKRDFTEICADRYAKDKIKKYK